jgi:hypothetical protein
MPFSFSGLDLEIVFATAASSRTARFASSSYASRFSFIFWHGGERHGELGDKATHLDHLADLLRDLGRRLQAISDYRDRLYDGAKDIEHGDGVVEARHVDEGGAKCEFVSAGLVWKRSR